MVEGRGGEEGVVGQGRKRKEGRIMLINQDPHRALYFYELAADQVGGG